MAFLNEDGVRRLWQHILAKINLKADKTDVEAVANLVGDEAVSIQISNAIAENEEIYVGPEEPTNSNVDVWIDTDANADTPEEWRASLDVYSKAETDMAVSKRDRVINLLDNSDFTNPVNQRGQTTYYNADYTIDRWVQWRVGDDISVEVTEAGLTLNPSSTKSCQLCQPLAIRLKEGDEVTAYVEFADGTVDVVNFTLVSGYSPLEGTNCYYRFGTDAFIFDTNQPITIKRVALYKGRYTRDNVPTYQPKGYAHELMECMRYYQVGENLAYGMLADYNGAISINFQYPVEMRIKPTVTFPEIKTFKTTATNNNSETYTGAIVDNGSTKKAYIGYIRDQGRQAFVKVSYRWIASAEL